MSSSRSHAVQGEEAVLPLPSSPGDIDGEEEVLSGVGAEGKIGLERITCEVTDHQDGEKLLAESGLLRGGKLTYRVLLYSFCASCNSALV